MADIPLRSYLHDIEKDIESGRTDQAIAHSRFILQTYPKYVNAYRLLGKAYLESQRFSDASDIFQRVLSSVPEDFVSHVGMSIIREDEGNLDESIWHMERAFEGQPSNNAIQEELRRLYGRRDNVEPPKIRLTRGALARLYYKGELFQQAIAEIRATLSEHPERLELQVMLAEVYLKTDQRVEAADTALAILRRLPHCVSAIQVMIRVLEGTDREMELRSYKQRLAQLDPYSVFMELELADVENVPDQSVRIEKLEWKPDQSITSQSQPAWAASLGVDLGDLTAAEPGSLPLWLDNAGSGQDQSESMRLPEAFIKEEEAEAAAADFETLNLEPEEAEEIPDWLADAGWKPKTLPEADIRNGLETEPVGSMEQTDEPISETEIPDWLRAMAPIDAETSPTDKDQDISPWLEQLLPPEEAAIEPAAEEEAAFGAETLPDWLITADVETGEVEASETAALSGSNDLFSDEDLESKEGHGLESLLSESETFLVMEQPAEVTPAVELNKVFETEITTEEELPVEVVPESEPPDFFENQPASEADIPITEESAVESELSFDVESFEASRSTFENPPSGDEALELSNEPPVGEAEAELAPESREEIAGTNLEEAGEPQNEPTLTMEGLEEWLLELQASSESKEVAFEGQAEQALKAEEIPDWLRSISTEGEEIDKLFDEAGEDAVSSGFEEGIDLPDWLQQTEHEEVGEGEAEFAAEIPSWLIEMKETGSSTKSEPAEEEKDELTVEYIRDEDSVLMEEVSGDTQPTRIRETSGEVEAIDQHTAEEAELEGEEVQAVLDSLEPTEPEIQAVTIAEIGIEGEMEAAFAWLMGLQAVELTEPEAEVDIEEQAVVAALELEIEPAGEEDEALFKQEMEVLVEIPSSELEAEFEESIAEVEFEPTLDELDLSEGTALDLSLEAEASSPEQPEESETAESKWMDSVEAPENLDKPVDVANDLVDQDAAFAWLESLAVRQGATEALFTNPEDRAEEMPDWIKQDDLSLQSEEDVQESSSEAEDIAETDFALETEGIDDTETALEVERTIEAESILTEEEPTEAEMPLEAVDEIETFYSAEAVQEEIEPAGETLPIESKTEDQIPELPDWLSEPSPTQPDQTPWMPETSPTEPLDLNTASLSELERLPGVGFVNALRISDYREAQGNFHKVEDLLQVPGIDAATVESIQAFLFVEAPKPVETPESVEPPSEAAIWLRETRTLSLELATAREALRTGNLHQAMEEYGRLIHANQDLNHIAQDLEETTQQYPKEVDVWQNLGDVYLRLNRVQEALQAFIKAEQLLG